MNRRNFFASLISAVVVKASVELGVLEEVPQLICERPEAWMYDPARYQGEWKWKWIYSHDDGEDRYFRAVFKSKS